jgi:hypothetical protein
MKKLLLVLSGLMAIVILMAFSSNGVDDTMSSSGAPAGYSGDPFGGNRTCNISGCHTGAPLGTLTGVISSNIPGTGYIAGSTYTITANFVRKGHTRFGFEISPQNTSGAKLGTLANISGTQLLSTGRYVTHTSSSISGSGSRTWAFKWTAPATGLGPVTFYGAFNATNANGNTGGDSIFKSTFIVTENTTAVNNIEASTLSFSAFPNPTHDNLNVKFTLPEPSSTEMDLIDMNGNKVGNLFPGEEMSGEVSKSFDLSSYQKGIYFLRLNVNGNYTLQKIVKL